MWHYSIYNINMQWLHSTGESSLPCYLLHNTHTWCHTWGFKLEPHLTWNKSTMKNNLQYFNNGEMWMNRLDAKPVTFDYFDCIWLTELILIKAVFDTHLHILRMTKQPDPNKMSSYQKWKKNFMLDILSAFLIKIHLHC